MEEIREGLEDYRRSKAERPCRCFWCTMDANEVWNHGVSTRVARFVPVIFSIVELDASTSRKREMIIDELQDYLAAGHPDPGSRVAKTFRAVRNLNP